MNGLTALVLALTAVVAVIDWLAVAAGRRSVEYVVKPLTTVGLIAVAVLLEPTNGAARTLFVLALVMSLVGDVALMLPDRQRLFPVGLGAFLLAHLVYIPGLWLLGVNAAGFIVGLVVVLVSVAVAGRPVVVAVRRHQPALAVPVAVYLTVISAMVVSAWGTWLPFAIVGAVTFYASDAILAHNEFVAPRRWAGPAVMVTYHVGQALLVLALVAW
jgi:uncharacterized membrane protein YhhN